MGQVEIVDRRVGLGNGVRRTEYRRPLALHHAKLARRSRHQCSRAGLANRREHGGSSISGGFEKQRHVHRVEHLHHAVADVMSDDSFDAVLTQEPGDPRVMASRRAFIVQPAPRDLDCKPTLDLAVDDVGHGDPIGAAPPVVDLSIFSYWYARDHLCSVLRWEPGPLCPSPRPPVIPAPLGRTVGGNTNSPTATFTTMTNIRFGAISLDCADPGRLAQFWAELLGGEIAFQSDGGFKG